MMVLWTRMTEALESLLKKDLKWVEEMLLEVIPLVWLHAKESIRDINKTTLSSFILAAINIHKTQWRTERKSNTVEELHKLMNRLGKTQLQN
ncbi:unnamed protein product [Cuscuta campestris]|uniref:Uncharacterized protein n=1 Tax=Cuscuta campestris TaxID=132261 RepID=A0A484NB41_9ASTE|nr:unnamed protein product [Cuscuta campestris]